METSDLKVGDIVCCIYNTGFFLVEELITITGRDEDFPGAVIRRVACANGRLRRDNDTRRIFISKITRITDVVTELQRTYNVSI